MITGLLSTNKKSLKKFYLGLDSFGLSLFIQLITIIINLMKNTIKTTKDKTFHAYNVEVSNGNKYVVEFNWEAPKENAWYIKEGDDCISGECLCSFSTKRKCIEWIKYWNNID